MWRSAGAVTRVLTSRLRRRDMLHGRREMHAELAPFAQRRSHLYGAVMPAHNAEHGGQPEAASDELRREEWVEDPTHGFSSHARAGIGHLDGHVRTGLRPVGRLHLAQMLRRQVHALGAHDDRAGRRSDRIGRVHHEIRHNLSHLPRVGAQQ